MPEKPGTPWLSKVNVLLLSVKSEGASNESERTLRSAPVSMTWLVETKLLSKRTSAPVVGTTVGLQFVFEPQRPSVAPPPPEIRRERRDVQVADVMKVIQAAGAP